MSEKAYNLSMFSLPKQQGQGAKGPIPPFSVLWAYSIKECTLCTNTLQDCPTRCSPATRKFSLISVKTQDSNNPNFFDKYFRTALQDVSWPRGGSHREAKAAQDSNHVHLGPAQGAREGLPGNKAGQAVTKESRRG